MSSNPNSSDFHYKEYSLQQLDNWVHDALNCDDLSPQDIYNTIIQCVDESVEHHKNYLDKSIKLLSLLKGHREVEFDLTATGEKFSTQYTDEELDAMCERAATEEYKQKCREYNLREAEYYNKRAELDLKKDKVKKWVLPVEQGNIDGVTDYYIEFPDDLLEAANLKEGDTVEWVDNSDGSFQLKKVGKKHMTYDEMVAAGWTMTGDGFWIKEHSDGELEVR